MMYMMNTATTCNLSTILAEDVGAAELRNPKLYRMKKTRRSLFSRLFKRAAAKK